MEGPASNKVSVWKGLPSWSIEDCLLCPHVVDREELSGASFINEDSALIQALITAQWPYLLISITSVEHTNFGETQILSL